MVQVVGGGAAGGPDANNPVQAERGIIWRGGRGAYFPGGVYPNPAFGKPGGLAILRAHEITGSGNVQANGGNGAHRNMKSATGGGGRRNGNIYCRSYI